MTRPTPGRPPEPARLSRRLFLGAGAATAAAFAVPSAPTAVAARRPRALGFVGAVPVRLAMHQHGSWSEAHASWQAQLTQATAADVDVVYLTDHDFRATASGYITSLAGITWARSTTGSAAQQDSTASGGAIRLLVESASATTAASVTMTVSQSPLTLNPMRTSISGQVLEQTITTATLSGGARYEIGIDLSYHPATEGRRAGNYRLVYRFGGTSTGRTTENGGLTGVVLLPTPTTGSVQELSPETDVAAIWPAMLAIDNAMYGLAFTVRSPHRGDVADVRVGDLRFVRSRSTPSAVTEDQQRLVATYQPLFPALTVKPTTEISGATPDLTPFGVAPYYPEFDAQLSTDHDTRYHQIAAHVHGEGGLVSWDHPFGTTAGSLLSESARITKRRKVYRSMRAVNQFEADILEVGFTVRGQVDTQTHLDLWDTFSRNGIWLTGNGVNDDHTGQHWTTLNNGFLTGAWAAGTSDAELRAALAGGRAFAYHPGRWAGAELDLLVDGAVPMGSVSVATEPTRRMAIWAPNLPAGSTVRVVSGRVDYSGAVDPGTTVARDLPSSAFTGGLATITVDTATSRFYRLTVLTSAGPVAAISNPVWLLRTTPPGGVPAARG